MQCLSCMGRKVKYGSPANSPSQSDQQARDAADYAEAMRQFQGKPAPAQQPTQQPAPSRPVAPDDDVTTQIYKKPPPNKGGYFKLPFGGSK